MWFLSMFGCWWCLQTHYPVLQWLPFWQGLNGPLVRYVKSAVCACAGNAGNVFFPPPRVSDPGIHHGTCVTHVSWCLPGSLTNGFPWSRRRGKRSPHSRRMRNPKLYVSGKRPIIADLIGSHFHVSQHRRQQTSGEGTLVAMEVLVYKVLVTGILGVFLSHLLLEDGSATFERMLWNKFISTSSEITLTGIPLTNIDESVNIVTGNGLVPKQDSKKDDLTLILTSWRHYRNQCCPISKSLHYVNRPDWTCQFSVFNIRTWI